MNWILLKINVYILVTSEIDFETAKNAKLPFVGVAWGFRNKKLLEDIGADYIVNTPQDLISILSC